MVKGVTASSSGRKASVYLRGRSIPIDYQYRKVWREGLEVAIKIKGSQGRPRIEWLKPEHPFTAISPKSDVHANHNEAHNSSLRRRASADHRRQNHYAKVVQGLQRALNVQRLGTVGFPDARAETRQRLIHNWVRPHWGLAKNQTPAMAMGYLTRPVSMLELLCSRGFQYISF